MRTTSGNAPASSQPLMSVRVRFAGTVSGPQKTFWTSVRR